jgi:hypothetical protein
MAASFLGSTEVDTDNRFLQEQNGLTHGKYTG